MWLTDEICGYLAGDGDGTAQEAVGAGTKLIELLAPSTVRNAIPERLHELLSCLAARVALRPD